MKHNKIIFATLMVAGLVFLNGCEKEKISGNLMLTAERYSSTDKTSVSSSTTTWMSGDVVNLNGTACTVTVNGENEAYVNAPEAVATADVIYGYYPASIVSSYSGTTTQTVTIPSSYLSSFSGGNQIIAMPMAARADQSNETSIDFSHLTAAVNVRVRNNTGELAYLDSVVLVSSTYQLSGSKTIDFTSSPSYGIAANNSDVAAADKRVKVYFEANTVSLANGGIKDVLVPVLPMGSGAVTVNVYMHKLWGGGYAKAHNAYNYSYSLTAPALARNQMATAQIAVDPSGGHVTVIPRGVFTINASGDKVRFSQGNLRFLPSTKTFYFAENQYERIGQAYGNTSWSTDGTSQAASGTYDEGSNYSATMSYRTSMSNPIDLFGYGTSGRNINDPYNSDPCDVYSVASSYPSVSGGIGSSNYDWGKWASQRHSGIYMFEASIDVDRGNLNLSWRTPKSAELQYILNSRSDDYRYMFASVNSVNGLIIFPDGFEWPSGLTAPSAGIVNSSSAYGNISAADWHNYLEPLGCVFLPTTGFRAKLTVSTYGSMGQYWTGTSTTAMKINTDNGSFVFEDGSKNQGRAVRLVRTVTE